MRRSKTSLFLIELMISLLLFGLCSAICLSIFAASNRRLKEAEDITNAVFHATAMAEIYKSYPNDMEKIKEHFENGIYLEDRFTVYFDEDWNPTIHQVLSSQWPGPGVYMFMLEIIDDFADISVIRVNGSTLPNNDEPIGETLFHISVKAVTA